MEAGQATDAKLLPGECWLLRIFFWAMRVMFPKFENATTATTPIQRDNLHGFSELESQMANHSW